MLHMQMKTLPRQKKKVEKAINLKMYRKGWRDFCWSNSFVGLEGANLCVNAIADDDGFIGRKGGRTCCITVYANIEVGGKISHFQFQQL